MNTAITMLLLFLFLDGVLEGVRWTHSESRLLEPFDIYHPLIGMRNLAAFIAVIAASVNPPLLINYLGAWLLGNAGFRETAINTITRGKVPWRKPNLMGFPRYPVIELILAVTIGGWLCLAR